MTPAASAWCNGRMYLATTADANELLASDPLALLIGMLLDQQIPMEKAFTSPAVLRERMGGGDRLDARAIAEHDPEQFVELFRTPPALHRFPGSMAARTQELARYLVATYDGDAAQVWTTAATGADLVARLAALPGFGAQKAKIFTALLGKQYGVTPKGWQQAAGDYGKPGRRSVADVVDAASLAKVREFKKQAKAAARSAAAS